MSERPLWTLSAVELQQRVVGGQCRIEDIAESCLARIAQREPAVRAWSWCDPAQVLAAARRVDSLGATGALSGVPVGIKDIIDTVDMPTAYGSVVYRGHMPQRDAALVTRLRAAGALIAGKTVTTEFAYAAPGPTRNPHQHLHTPGGSSSGSAAAVAAGMVPVAISSQTGGSTIRPAAFCGVVGFKPTHGAIDSAGMKPLAPSSDTVGLHARSVGDIALVLPVLSDTLGPAPALSPDPVRIAWFPGPHAAEATAQGRAALERARQLLLDSGFVVEPPPLSLQDMQVLSETNRLVMAFEAARSLDAEYQTQRAALAAPSVELIETGRSIAPPRYLAALTFVEQCRASFAASMAGFDLLMTFSAPGVAPLASEGLGTSIFNRAWSALGVPCLNLPCGRSDDLPLGAQFVATAGQDLGLLDLGRRIEHVFRPLNPTVL